MGMLIRKLCVLLVISLFLTPAVFAVYGGGQPSSSGGSGGDSGGSGGGGGGGGGSSTTSPATTPSCDECSPLGTIECIGTNSYKSCSLISGCNTWEEFEVPDDRECVGGYLYPILTDEEKEIVEEDEEVPQDIIFTAPEAERPAVPTGAAVAEPKGIDFNNVSQTGVVIFALVALLSIGYLIHKKKDNKLHIMIKHHKKK